MGRYRGINLERLVAFVGGEPRRLLALMPIVAAAVALGVSLAQPERFRASAELWFGRTTDARSLAAAAAGVGTDAEPLAANLALTTLDTAAARVKRRMPGPVTVDDLKHAIDVRFDRNSDLVTVTAEWDEPTRAASIANRFAEEIVALRRQTARAEVQRAIDVLSQRIEQRRTDRARGEEIRSLRERVARLELLKALQTGDVQIVERATPPAKASSPNPLRNALLAAFIALIAALGVVALLGRIDDRVRDEHELTSLIPASVLGRIPEARLKPIGHQDRDFADACQFVSMQLQLVRPEGECMVLAVTSPAAGDGKTTVVSCLAHSLALNGVEVVAMDCADFVSPRSGSIDPARLQRALGPIRDAADFVLVDTPPVSTTADASAVARTADGVILVVDVARARRKELRAAKRQLDNARTELLGIILNRAPARLPAPAPHKRADPEPEPAGQPGPPTFTA